jgi:predicted DNA-binding protein with PD1-like motif
VGEVRYQSAEGEIGKVVAARLLPGTDLVEGIEKVCEDHGISYGLVNCIGSLQKATFMYVVPIPEAKVGAGYTAPYELPGPIEFLGGLALVCETESGEKNTHLHGSFCDQLDHLYGGHLVKGGNPILVTMDLAIIELTGMKVLRRYDEETDLVNLAPEAE